MTSDGGAVTGGAASDGGAMTGGAASDGSATASSPFTPDVVAAISRHMNDDHAADSLLIVRAFGGQPAATGARMTGLDADGLDFTAEVAGGPVPVRVPFGGRLGARAEVRREVVRLYREACTHLGVAPRAAG